VFFAALAARFLFPNSSDFVKRDFIGSERLKFFIQQIKKVGRVVKWSVYRGIEDIKAHKLALVIPDLKFDFFQAFGPWRLQTFKKEIIGIPVNITPRIKFLHQFSDLALSGSCKDKFSQASPDACIFIAKLLKVTVVNFGRPNLGQKVFAKVERLLHIMDIFAETLETYLFDIRGSGGVFTVKIAVVLYSAYFLGKIKQRCRKRNVLSHD